MTPVPRTLGLRLIIAYKFVKGALMLALALWFTVDPAAAYTFGQHVAHELVEARPVLVRLGEWLHTHLTERIIHQAALVAWLDGLTTSLEATLLALGKPWGEWLVAFSVGLLLPFEGYELWHKPSAAKAIVLGLNAVIVVYLVSERLRHRSRQEPRGVENLP